MAESDNVNNVDNVDIVDPWQAKCGAGGFKYDRLIEKFGVQPITEELLDRFKKVTGVEPHYWLKRQIFFAHRELERILDAYEQKKPIFLYTGRGPTTESLHFGHMLPFIFMKWLQDVFGAYLVIQMSDDEKYQFKDNLKFEEIHRLGFENAKDIIACGFDREKTFIFSNSDFTSNNPHVYPFLMEMMKNITVHTVQDTFFGKEERKEKIEINNNIIEIPIKERRNCTVGQLLWPVQQAAPAFSKFFPQIFGNQEALCLVVYAIDQDPYFRDARDVAPKIEAPKPCSIMSKFLPSLAGEGKMSSTGETANYTIYMTDTPNDIKNKVNKYAFSGGRDTIEQHRQLGGNVDIDVSFQYLVHFLENDDELSHISQAYSSGKMLTGELKKILIDLLTKMTQNHQLARSKITDSELNYYYDLNKFINKIVTKSSTSL